MPWKECHVVDERLRFVARLLDGEKMAGLCAEFGISRKTGYKIYKRYKGCGIEGLTDRSRRSQRHANHLPMAIETLIVRLKKDYPTWGAPKIRERLRRRYSTVHCPAWAGESEEQATGAGRRDGAGVARHAECLVVCRLQRRIHAGQSGILLSADDH